MLSHQLYISMGGYCHNGGLINRRRADILLKNFLRPCMAPPRTTVTFPNGDQITLVSGRPSVRVLIQLLGSRGYSVEVHLFPLNVLSLVPAADRPSSFFFRDAILTVRTPAVAPVISAPISIRRGLRSGLLLPTTRPPSTQIARG